MSMFETAMFLELLEQYQKNCHKNSAEKGFWDEERFPDLVIPGKIALIHSELSEALEAYRKGNPPDQHCPDFLSVDIELADAVIRILDLCGKLNIDLGRAILAKMEFNSNRPKMHGKNC